MDFGEGRSFLSLFLNSPGRAFPSPSPGNGVCVCLSLPGYVLRVACALWSQQALSVNKLLLFFLTWCSIYFRSFCPTKFLKKSSEQLTLRKEPKGTIPKTCL